MTWKDNFSTQADSYARYRPHYPRELYEFLQQLQSYDNAWDCGTGNGQVAVELAKFCNHVHATDASAAQLAHAPTHPKITYRVAHAEHSGLSDHSVDLITVAQAIHWFDFERFYAEVRRVARPNALIAVWGYGLLKIDPDLDQMIEHFYYQVVGDFWDAERKHLDQEYRSIPFPFKSLDPPQFKMSLQWDLADLLGYFATWSSVQKMLKLHLENPLDKLASQLAQQWGNPTESRAITWDIYLKLGRMNLLSSTTGCNS